MRRRAFCERCCRLYLLGPVGVCAWRAGSRRGNVRSRLARFRPRLACSVSLDVANSSFEGQAFLGDCRFRGRRTNGAKLPHLRRACSFIERPASLASVLVETPDGLGDERMVSVTETSWLDQAASSTATVAGRNQPTSRHPTSPSQSRTRLRTADLVIQCLVNGCAAHREGRRAPGPFGVPANPGKPLASSPGFIGEFRLPGATAQRREPFINSLKHLLNFSL